MTKKIAESLPTSFGKLIPYPYPPPLRLLEKRNINFFFLKRKDWRNVNGVNYVSPIRNQQSCGSCYTFGSMAMHEARLRIYSNNTKQTVFSTQDIVECSVYSQGCDGGFPYLVAGKYSEDFGVVEEAVIYIY
jgi:cathepsin C